MPIEFFYIFSKESLAKRSLIPVGVAYLHVILLFDRLMRKDWKVQMNFQQY